MKRQPKTELEQYAQMGIAAMIPGFQRAIDVLQHQLDQMRAQLAGTAPEKKEPKPHRISPEGRAAIAAAQRRRWANRPKKETAKKTAGKKATSWAKNYWNSMTAEERAKEMRRRMAKREAA